MSSQKSDLRSLSSLLSSTAISGTQPQPTLNNPPPLQLPQRPQSSNLEEEDDPIDSAFQKEKEGLAKSCQEFMQKYKEERVRMKNNVAEARRELLAKYFSDKDIFGDDISEDVKAGRCIGTESYADPLRYQKQKAAAETSTSNGEQRTRKRG